MNFRSGSHFHICSGGESRSCPDRIFWCLMYVTQVFKMLRFGSLGIGDVGGEPEWVWACKDLLSAGDIGTVSGGFEALDRVSRILLGLRLLQAYAWIVRCLWTFDVISTPVALRHYCACYMQIVFLLLWNWLQTMWEKLIQTQLNRVRPEPIIVFWPTSLLLPKLQVSHLSGSWAAALKKYYRAVCSLIGHDLDLWLMF